MHFVTWAATVQHAMQAAASTAGKTGSAGKASDQDTVSSATLKNRRKQALKKARKEAAAAASKPAKQQLDEQASIPPQHNGSFFQACHKHMLHH